MSLSVGEVRFAIATIDGTYAGKVNDDGASITGTWTQGGQVRPLNLTRPKDDLAWEVPVARTAMTKDVDPDWEVVAVRPTDPASTNVSIRMNGRQFVLENRTVETLILHRRFALSR